MVAGKDHPVRWPPPAPFNHRPKEKPMIDIKSVALCFITLFTGIWAKVTVGNTLAIISLVAGLTTIVYNIIRIYKECKKEK